jgi:hypothetical protein
VLEQVTEFLNNPDDETHELTQAVAGGDQSAVFALQQKFMDSAFGKGLDVLGVPTNANKFIKLAQDKLKNDEVRVLVMLPCLLLGLGSGSVMLCLQKWRGCKVTHPPPAPVQNFKALVGDANTLGVLFSENLRFPVEKKP